MNPNLEDVDILVEDSIYVEYKDWLNISRPLSESERDSYIELRKQEIKQIIIKALKRENVSEIEVD